MHPGLGARLLPALRWLLAAGLLFYVWRSGLLHPSALAEILHRPGWAVGALAMISGSILLSGWRWYLLLRAQGGVLGGGRVLAATYGALFVGQLLWGGMSGDAYRIYYLLRRTSRGRAGLVLSVVMDRLAGLGGLMCLGLGASVLFWPQVASHPELLALTVSFAAVLLVMVSSLLVAFLFAPSLLRYGEGRHWREGKLPQRALWRLLEAAVVYRRRPGVVAFAWLLSLGVHLFTLGAVVMVGEGLALGHLDLGRYLFVTPWSLLINNLPLTPGGLGVGESAFARLCTLMEPPPASGAAYGSIFLAFRAASALATLPGAMVHFLGEHRARQRRNHHPPRGGAAPPAG